MTDKEKKWPLQTARNVADGIVESLKPYCDKIAVLGSIRRERGEVGDIEILCIPKTLPNPYDLFDGGEIRYSEFINTVNSMQKVKGDAENGKYFQRIHESGITVDIFTADAKNWGVQKMIRTGPWEYSKGMVTDIKEFGFRVADGGYLQKYRAGAWHTIPCYYEKDFYKITGQPYIIPLARI